MTNYQNHRNSVLLTWLVYCAAWMTGGAAVAATPAPCMNAAQEVVIRGIVSNEHVNASDGRDLKVWMITTENPVCINVVIDGDTAQISQTWVSRIQVLGPIPPVGVPVDLKGTLKTGNSTKYYAVPNTLMINSIATVNKTVNAGSSGTEAASGSLAAKSSRKDDAEMKPQKAANRTRSTELKTPSLPRAISDALQTAKQMALLYKVDTLETEFDDTPGASGYSLYLHYHQDAFAEHLAGQKALIAFDNNYNLAREFVKQLIKIDQDPLDKKNPRYVDVCSVVDRVSVLTRKPEFELIGCARYDPGKDMIDPDFTKISERLVVPK